MSYFKMLDDGPTFPQNIHILTA